MKKFSFKGWSVTILIDVGACACNNIYRFLRHWSDVKTEFLPTCAYPGVRNFNFPEKFANVLNERSHIRVNYI